VGKREVSRQDQVELAANPAWREFIDYWSQRREQLLIKLAYGKDIDPNSVSRDRGKLEEMDEVIHYFDKQVNR